MTGHGASTGCAARCTIASTPGTTSSRARAEVTSAACTPSAAVTSVQRNCQPCSGSDARRNLPTRPAAPVTRTLVIPESYPGDQRSEQRAHPVRGRLPGCQYLFVIERVAESCCQIGDEGQPEHLEPFGTGGDRLEDSRHTDEIGTENAGHPNLGRCLVLRPGEHCVDTLGD